MLKIFWAGSAKTQLAYNFLGFSFDLAFYQVNKKIMVFDKFILYLLDVRENTLLKLLKFDCKEAKQVIA